MNWKYCQKNSDSILSSGLFQLLDQRKKTLTSECDSCYGNYFITDKHEKWTYTGEAKILSKRVKQHSKERSSTFFKNYLRHSKSSGNQLQLDDFYLKTIPTSIGRKELEEFAIVNIPTNLNKFQIGKRNLYENNPSRDLWKKVQDNHLKIIAQGEKELESMNSYKWFDAKIDSTAGLYIVEHKTKGLIYIGESSNIQKRYLTHSRKTYFSALRRNLGENLLGFQLQTIKGKKRYFTEKEDLKITEFLKHCSIKPFPITLGRFELEEALIRKYKPYLNRKENK